jgi:hypothetical protein
MSWRRIKIGAPPTEPAKSLADTMLARAERRRVVDQQVYMIRFTVDFPQRHLEVCADRPEDVFQSSEVSGAEDLAPPLGYKCQVRMQQINEVTAPCVFPPIIPMLETCQLRRYIAVIDK